MKKQCLLFIVLICSSLEMLPVKRRNRNPRQHQHRGQQWRSRLIKAITKNRPREAERLLQDGADPNECSLDLTPLYVALQKEIYLSLTDHLLAYGADPNGPHPNTKWTLLGSAIVFGTSQQVERLLQSEANPFNVRGELPANPARDIVQNMNFVNQERKKRIKTLLLCLNRDTWDGLLFLPNEIRVLITNEIKKIWQNRSDLQISLPKSKKKNKRRHSI